MNAGNRNLLKDGAHGKGDPRAAETEGEVDGKDVMQVDDMANAADNSTESFENKTPECRLEVRRSMLSRVAGTDAYFKQQLISDPDLTFSEKLSIASELLDRKPATFLERYGKYLVTDDLPFFEPLRGDYFVDFHLRELIRSFDSVTNDSKKIKNRRYEAMKRLLAAGEYFSDDETKKRDPLLFEEMIGRFLTSEEAADAVSKSDLSLSEVLLSHLQVMQNNELFDQQQQHQAELRIEEENRIVDDEEFDSDDSEEESEGPGQPSETEKANLRSEFLEIMQQRFLSGQDDVHFDYGEVDNNEDYDPIDLFSRDEEERYFAGDSDNDLDDDFDLREEGN